MLLTVCIEAGRSTLTHTSWTGPTPRFPQMDVWPSCCFGRSTRIARRSPTYPLILHPLRDPTLPSARRPPSPLDFYLSWMSPSFPELVNSDLRLGSERLVKLCYEPGRMLILIRAFCEIRVGILTSKLQTSPTTVTQAKSRARPERTPSANEGESNGDLVFYRFVTGTNRDRTPNATAVVC